MKTKEVLSEPLILSGFLSDKLPRLLLVIGVLGLALSLLFSKGALSEFYFSYLFSFTFFISLTLGSLFFVMIQHVSRAGWSAVIRRVPEVLMQNMTLMAILFVPLLFGLHDLYHWTHADAVAHDHLLQVKYPYLNTPFFVIRAVLFFLAWIWLARKFFKGSLAQDSSERPTESLALQKAATYGIIIFALTQTFAFIDWVMSLTPHWYSTIFGVYMFAGSCVVSLSFFSLLFLILRKYGFLKNVVSIEHYHDLGKLIYGFNVFWAYVAFSQYFLIWYGNLPEETVWYLDHFTGSWNTVAILLALGHFALPFILFMTRHAKRNLTVHLLMVLWIIAMHFLDLYWVIMPIFSPKGFTLGLVPILCFIGFFGLYFSAFLYRLKKVNLIPRKDPYLKESLEFHNF